MQIESGARGDYGSSKSRSTIAAAQVANRKFQGRCAARSLRGARIIATLVTRGACDAWIGNQIIQSFDEK